MKPNPLLIVIGIVLVMILGAIGYYIYSRHNANEQIRTDIEGLRTQITAYQAKIARRGDVERNFQRIESRFDDVVEILPIESEQQSANVEKALTSFSSNAKLEFIRYVSKEAARPTAPAPRPGQPAALGVSQQQLLKEFGDRFEPTEVTVEYRGTFFQFLQFLAQVEQHKELLRVDQVSLVPTGGADDSRMLSITVTLSTFHYKVKG